MNQQTGEVSTPLPGSLTGFFAACGKDPYVVLRVLLN